MADTVYCFSDPAEPGLVRIALCEKRTAGERIDWSLKVRCARRALAALHRTMVRYRKDRGGGLYRCTPRHAKGITLRYIALPPDSWRFSATRLGAATAAILFDVGYVSDGSTGR